MAQPEILGTSVIDQDRLLRTILERTAGETGAGFFRAMVRAVAEALAVRGAWATELVGDGESARALAFRLGGDFVEGFRRPIAGTPCELVIRECRPVHVPDGVVEAYPADRRLAESDAVAYVGVPIPDTGGDAVLGTLALVHDEPLEIDERALTVFRFLADRAAAELRRLRDVSGRREAERRLRRLTAENEHLRRALATVVERAGIAAPRGRVGPVEDLPSQGAPPGEAADAARVRVSSSREEGPAPVLTEEEMRAFERENLVRALEASDWQVSGDEGAARLLGIPPSTLSSRMRSLGLERPE